MDTTKAAEVIDCDTTGMRNAQSFLRIRLADKIREEKARENVFLIRQRIQQLLTQVPVGESYPGGNVNPGGNLATPMPLMVVPGGDVNPGGNLATPGGNLANAGGNLANPGVNLATPGVNLTATPRPLMAVPDG